MADTGMTTCPHCEGRKDRTLVICGVGPRASICNFCEGKGEVTPEKAIAWIDGQALMDDRQARGLSLREEAKRLGITPRELSDREWGRAPGG